MAKRKTITEKAIELTILCGYSEVPSTSKYRTFAVKGSDIKIFIGPKGAFRRGRIASKSRSVYGTSLTHEKIDDLLAKKRK